MTSLSTAAAAAHSAPPASGKLEFQLHGDPEALRRLRDILESGGVFIQVDHEYRDTVWPDNGLVVGALLVPGAERVGDLEGGDRA